MIEFIYVNNDKKPYSIDEIKGGKIIYNDDLIWHEGLIDWTEAKNITFLQKYLKKRPPISKKKRLINKVLKTSINSFFIYFIFTLILSISSAFYEKYKYDSFMNKIIYAYKNNEKKREAERYHLEQIELEKNNKESLYINKIEELKNEVNINFSGWESELKKFPPDNSIIDYYKNVIDSLKGEIDYYYSLLETKNPVSFFKKNNTVKDVEYNIPMDEIYIMLDDGTYWSRWCAHNGNVFLNENISYNTCHKFLFRPYYSIFSVSNLSEEEQKNTLLLVFNYIFSGIVSNIPILALLFFYFYYGKTRFDMVSFPKN